MIGPQTKPDCRDVFIWPQRPMGPRTDGPQPFMRNRLAPQFTYPSDVRPSLTPCQIHGERLNHETVKDPSGVVLQAAPSKHRVLLIFGPRLPQKSGSRMAIPNRSSHPEFPPALKVCFASRPRLFASPLTTSTDLVGRRSGEAVTEVTRGVLHLLAVTSITCGTSMTAARVSPKMRSTKGTGFDPRRCKGRHAREGSTAETKAPIAPSLPQTCAAPVEA